jgi:hypothetical protein
VRASGDETAEALREYGGLLLLTDVTLPGTPEQERHRPNVAIPLGCRPSGRSQGAVQGKPALQAADALAEA